MIPDRIPRPRVKRYPPGDPAFRASVENSIGAVTGRPIEDEGILAAVQALVRTTFPLAIVRVRFEGAPPAPSWDAFRDESVLDDEMVLRARTGDHRAVEDLYDRHHDLAFRVALRVAADAQVAAGAVVSAFRVLVADREAAWPPRIRLAMASCDAAIEAVPDRLPSRADMARAVTELASVDRFSAPQIAAVMRLNEQHVAALAIEGMRSSARTSA